HPVRAALAAARDEDRDLNALVAALRHRHEGDAFRRVVYSESHDEVANGKARLPTEIDPVYADGYPARKRSMLAALLALTAPGIPMLFQGQEVLENEWFRDEVPVDWAKLAHHGSIHAFYRDLIALRRDLRGFSVGLTGQHIEVNHVNHGDKVLGYRRWREDGAAGGDVLVVLNLSTYPRNGYEIGVPREGVWHVRLNTDSTAYSGDFADHGEPAAEARPDPLDGYAHRITIDIAPYSALILSRDRA
ncbi:MAG: alpha amylase C-terminal domain-containing protein, partial [Burkholderiales bacterium]|nr:alpha amylase C-terminal domain-containing protein [Opitutaceae bacterium]